MLSNTRASRFYRARLRVTYKQLLSELIACESWGITQRSVPLVCIAQTIICLDSARATLRTQTRVSEMVCTQTVVAAIDSARANEAVMLMRAEGSRRAVYPTGPGLPQSGRARSARLVQRDVRRKLTHKSLSAAIRFAATRSDDGL